MQVKRKIKAGAEHPQHHEPLGGVQKPTHGLQVKTRVKAGTPSSLNFTKIDYNY